MWRTRFSEKLHNVWLIAPAIALMVVAAGLVVGTYELCKGGCSISETNIRYMFLYSVISCVFAIFLCVIFANKTTVEPEIRASLLSASATIFSALLAIVAALLVFQETNRQWKEARLQNLQQQLEFNGQAIVLRNKNRQQLEEINLKLKATMEDYRNIVSWPVRLSDVDKIANQIESQVSGLEDVAFSDLNTSISKKLLTLSGALEQRCIDIRSRGLRLSREDFEIFEQSTLFGDLDETLSLSQEDWSTLHSVRLKLKEAISSMIVEDIALK